MTEAKLQPATFVAPALPWLEPQALPQSINLGAGLDARGVRAGLELLCAQSDVWAVLAFGSRARGDGAADSDLDLAVISEQSHLTPQDKMEAWRRYRQLLGSIPVGVDLLVTGKADAARLAGSRWHVMGDVAREGKVLYVAS
jgi:predicted nucleotidyltransferase